MAARNVARRKALQADAAAVFERELAVQAAQMADFEGPDMRETIQDRACALLTTRPSNHTALLTHTCATVRHLLVHRLWTPANIAKIHMPEEQASSTLRSMHTQAQQDLVAISGIMSCLASPGMVLPRRVCSWLSSQATNCKRQLVTWGDCTSQGHNTD